MYKPGRSAGQQGGDPECSQRPPNEVAGGWRIVIGRLSRLQPPTTCKTAPTAQGTVGQIAGVKHLVAHIAPRPACHLSPEAR